MKKVTIITSIIIFFTFFNIKLNAVSNITCESKLFLFENNTYKEVTGLNIKDQSKVKFQFQLSSNQEVEAIIENIEIIGAQVTKLDSISSIVISKQPKLIEVEAIVDSSKGKLKSNIQVSIAKELQSFSFKYYMERDVKDKVYTTNFFGTKGELISSVNTTRSEYVNIPEYTTTGYDIIGFNENKDGSGKYFVHSQVDKNTNYYAIAKPKVFVVEYYIEDELYSTRNVEYNQKAYYLTPPVLEGKNFITWLGLLDNVEDNIKVYGIYEDYKTNELALPKPIEDILKDKESKYNINYEEIRNKLKQKEHLLQDSYFVELQEEGKLSYLPKKETIKESKNNTLLYIIIVLELILVIVFIRRRKKANKAI